MIRNFIDQLERRLRGEQAESAAANYLLGQGLSLKARNYRCRLGEIDLICGDGEVLVFVEVRYRRSNTYGGALASVDRRKQEKLVAAAQHYLAHHRLHHLPCRFDVVAVNAQNNRLEFDWLQNAFC